MRQQETKEVIMQTDNPTKQIMYKITSPIPIDGIGEKWTDSEVEAQKAYELGFLISKVDIVRAVVSTGQTLTTGLTTDWRGK